MFRMANPGVKEEKGISFPASSLTDSITVLKSMESGEAMVRVPVNGRILISEGALALLASLNSSGPTGERLPHATNNTRRARASFKMTPLVKVYAMRIQDRCSERHKIRPTLSWWYAQRYRSQGTHVYLRGVCQPLEDSGPMTNKPSYDSEQELERTARELGIAP